MNIKFKYVEGSQAERPQEIDTSSSKSTVYIRKNIEQIEKEQGEETVTLWAYDEAQLTKAEYIEYQNDDILAKLEYLEMLLDE